MGLRIISAHSPIAYVTSTSITFEHQCLGHLSVEKL